MADSNDIYSEAIAQVMTLTAQLGQSPGIQIKLYDLTLDLLNKGVCLPPEVLIPLLKSIHPANQYSHDLALTALEHVDSIRTLGHNASFEEAVTSWQQAVKHLPLSERNLFEQKCVDMPI